MSKKTDKVRIRKDGVQAEVLAKSAKVWLRNGWTLVDDGSSETQVDAAQLSLLDHENKE